jgi:hypothetical protein
MSHNPLILSTHPNVILEQYEDAAITRTIDWSGRIGDDTIASSTWTAENSGPTIANEATSSPQTSARLSGTPGRYLFTNKITLTTSGDTMEQQIVLIVRANSRYIGNDYRDYGYSW